MLQGIPLMNSSETKDGSNSLLNFINISYDYEGAISKPALSKQNKISLTLLLIELVSGTLSLYVNDYCLRND